MKILIAVAVMTAIVHCDLPIHCLSSQIEGIWQFQVSPPLSLVSPLMNKCGHEIPDNDQLSYKSLDWPDFEAESTLRLSLKKEGVVEISRNKMYRPTQMDELINKHGNGKNSNWTMIYDQGFMVDLANGFNFFVYNKYNADGVSDCSKTLMGWYQQKSIVNSNNNNNK